MSQKTLSLERQAQKTLVVYIDGACKGNPGHGGWAFCSVDGVWEGSGHSSFATNNEMEMMAALETMKSVPPGSIVQFVTDSKLIIGWLSQGWKCSTNPKIPPMIKEYFRYRQEKNLEVSFQWVKGHNGDRYNGYVDSIASQRCKG